MSLQFSNTTTKNGILQQIERNCGFRDGDITNSPILLAQFTGDVNTTHDRVLSMIFEVGGQWQFDDSNHEDYPIITHDITQGRRDYSFTTDEQGNLILDIFKVMVKDSEGLYRELFPVDQQGNSLTGYAPANYSDGQNTQGQPNTYDKTANGIFLDPIPDYTIANGLKVFINREGSYFTTTDTTKKPGIAGLFHEYYALRPAYLYLVRNKSQAADRMKQEVLDMEESIKNHYKLREKDNPKRMIPMRVSSH